MCGDKGKDKNMRKRVVFLTVLLSVFLLTACGNSSIQAESNSQTAEDTVRQTDTGQSRADEESSRVGENTGQSGEQKRILIAWFSRVGNTDFPDDVDAVSSASLNLQNGELLGNTELIANMIQEETNGELFRIETEKSYPVDYGKSEPDEDSRPALSSHVDNLDDYEIIFLGLPNWWFDMPMPVYSFLEEYDFSGKTVIPFYTHGGSKFSDIVSTLKEMLLGATVMDGFEVYGENAVDAGNDVADWLKELDETLNILQDK